MNDNDIKEININGVIYVRKDCIPEAKPVNIEGMPYVICTNVGCMQDTSRATMEITLRL